VHVLAVIHGERVRAGVFGDVVEERGHRLEEWSLAWEQPLPRPLDAYGAVMVFGGAMHADQDAHHPWLLEENLFLQRVLDLHLPVLGVCLGAQLLAKAAHAPVHPAPQPEIGWHTVELTHEAGEDPVFAQLPQRLEAFQWHYYTYGVPAGGVELARNETCTQGFRLGDVAWGIQFHAEVTRQEIIDWLDDPGDDAVDREALIRETDERIDAWNALGRDLCGGFIAEAERAAVENRLEPLEARR
jgi:GMP synthase-like glutamine amidotransferase